MTQHLVWFMVLCAMLASPAVASWNIYGTVDYIAPMATETVAGNHLEFAQSLGWSAGAEWRFGPWGGVEIDYSHRDLELEYRGDVLANATVNPIALALNLHVIDGDRYDVYFAPVLAYLDWGPLFIRDGRIITVDSEVTTGVQGGASIKVTKHLSVLSSLRYLRMDLEQGAEAIGVDPLSLRVGLVVRF